MLLLVLLQAAVALRPVPLSSGRRLPLAPCDAPCRCSRVRCDFSPAYDTTIRHAALVEKRGGSALGQLALGRLLSAPDHATGCLKPRPASAAALAGHTSCAMAACFRRRYAAVDWAQNLRSLPGSLILRRIKSPLLFNIAITTIICLLHSLYGPWPAGIALPHTLLSSALGPPAGSKRSQPLAAAPQLGSCASSGARLAALGGVPSQGERPAHLAPRHRYIGCSSERLESR